MKYHFRIHKEGAGYWAECLELKGCQTQAKTREALTANMQQALELYLSEPEDSKILFPEPDSSQRGRGIIAVSVSPGVAFAVSLRKARLRAGLTQSEVAQMLKLGGLYSYQRLESPLKANPQLDTLARIKGVFPHFRLDRIF